MTIHVQGMVGFTSDAERAKAERALLEATSMPAALARGDGAVLSVTWEAPDEAYESIRRALGTLTEAAAGGHIDLRAPGHGAFRCFGGDTPWGFRSEPTPDGASARVGSVAFHFDRPVGRVAFGPHGELAVGGMRYARGSVAVFDARGDELLYAWAHERPDSYYGPEPVAVALSPAGDRVVSGSCDKRAVVRDVRSGRPLAMLQHPEVIRDVAWVGDTIITAGERCFSLWDDLSGKKPTKRASLEQADARILGHAAGIVFVYQGRSRLARLDVASGEILDAVDVGAGIIAVAPDGRHAIAVEKARKIAKAIAIHAGKKKVTVRLDAPPVALAFAGDGALIAALEDGALLVISPGGQITDRYAIAGKLSSGTRIAAAEDGRIAIATGDRCPIIIDRAQRAVVCAPDHIDAVVASPVDPTFVLLGHRPRWVDPRAGTERPLPGAREAAFSSDGALLAIYDGTLLRLLDGATLTERLQKKAPTIDHLVLSPDASTLVITGGDLSLFDVASGKASKLGKKGERASAAAFSPDGRTVAAARDAAIELFDLATGSVAATLESEAFHAYHLAFSPDGQRLAASSDKQLMGWDLTTKERIFALEQGAHALAWAPDGSTLAAGGWGAVTILDGRDGAVKERLYGHLGSVYSVAFTGDGAQLISVGEEGTALLVPRAASPLPPARPAAAPVPVALAERALAAEEAQKQKTTEASQAREAVRVDPPPSAALSIAHHEGFAPSPAVPRHPMRLRAHGTLLFPSKAALDEGVRKFDSNAYVEWYSAKDLTIADRTVTVDIETDLEVDCLTFGVSFQELARQAMAGAVHVAWDDQVTSMRFTAGSYGFEPEVPVLPPAARARYGHLTQWLRGHLVSDGKGAFAAMSSIGVTIVDTRAAVAHPCPVAARTLLAMDEASVVALSVRGVSNDREHCALQRVDRTTGAVQRSADASASMRLTRPGEGGHFVFYDENRAQLGDLTPRVLATVKLDKTAYIDDAAVDSTGTLVALATREGLFLWDPSNTTGPPARVPGAYTSVTFLASGELVALGSPDPAAKNNRSLLTRLRPSGEVIETVRAGKELARVRAMADGLLGSHDYEGVLGSFGPDLKKRWMIDATKKSGTLDMVASPDGRTLFCVSSGGALLGFDAATGARSTDHAFALIAMDATADLLASLDESGDLIVRARRTGELRFRHRLALKAEKNVHLVFAAAGLAVADSDRLVLIDVGRGTVRELEKNKLTCAARAGDGTLVTGHADGKVRFTGGAGPRTLEVGGDLRRIAVSASADRLACLFKDGTAAVIDGSGAKRTVKASREYAATLALSSDGRTLAFARTQKERYSRWGDVLLLDVDDGRERVVLSRARPGACLFTLDGSRLFVADGRVIRSIEPVSGSTMELVAGHRGDVRALSLPGDGQLLSASADQTALEWDLEAIAAVCGGLPREETGIPG